MYVDNANQMDRENNHENITLLEPIFEELYRFAQDHDCTEQFVKIVNGNIDAPWEMLTYCMAKLRIQRVLKASEHRLGNPPNLRYMNFHSQLVHVYNNGEWL